ncbi:MAG TPA: hypothetical protein VJ937_00740, partial [Salinivirga sp.]|uniref:hypothetical protein n=1 Tax=Salinivirga sp. TaxID=1970192 RepID=UPI002B468C20
PRHGNLIFTSNFNLKSVNYVPLTYLKDTNVANHIRFTPHFPAQIVPLKQEPISQFSKYPHPKAKAKPGSRFRDFFKNISRGVTLSTSLRFR